MKTHMYKYIAVCFIIIVEDNSSDNETIFMNLQIRNLFFLMALVFPPSLSSVFPLPS